METEKEPQQTGKKRSYRSPQVTEFGSVANITRVNDPTGGADNPNTGEMGAEGPMTPPGLGS